MRSAVCTLYEGHYHLGVGALINSLVQAGFKDTVWVGYRGALPPWSGLAEESADLQMQVGGLTVQFVPVDTLFHFTNYKPTFMLSALERAPNLEAVFYFDPDICVKCPWTFFEKWADCGIALVQEIVLSNMPSNHPFRADWASFAQRAGFSVHRELNQCFNGGFVGVHRRFAAGLEIWKTLIDRFPAEGLALDAFSIHDATNAMNVGDQAALNIMAMVTTEPLSTMGPEGMDFIPGGQIMSHATCSPKPWNKLYLPHAICGIPPSRADRVFWNYVSAPLTLFSAPRLLLRQLDLKLASLIGRFIKRA